MHLFYHKLVKEIALQNKLVYFSDSLDKYNLFTFYLSETYLSGIIRKAFVCSFLKVHLKSNVTSYCFKKLNDLL